MNGTHNTQMGDRGRLVIPAELRERAGLRDGRPIVLVETSAGVLLLTREQLRDLVRADLAGHDLVASLLADRRAAANAEDAA